MKKIVSILLLFPLISICQSYTIKKNTDGSFTRVNDFNPSDSQTMRINSDGSYKIIDDFNPLNSSTLRINANGSFTLTNDSNPANSTTLRKNSNGSYSITNDSNPLISSTISKLAGNSYRITDDYNPLNTTYYSINSSGNIQETSYYKPSYSSPNYSRNQTDYTSSWLPVVIESDGRQNNYTSSRLPNVTQNQNNYTSTGLPNVTRNQTSYTSTGLPNVTGNQTSYTSTGLPNVTGNQTSYTSTGLPIVKYQQPSTSVSNSVDYTNRNTRIAQQNQKAAEGYAALGYALGKLLAQKKEQKEKLRNDYLNGLLSEEEIDQISDRNKKKFEEWAIKQQQKALKKQNKNLKSFDNKNNNLNVKNISVIELLETLESDKNKVEKNQLKNSNKQEKTSFILWGEIFDKNYKRIHGATIINLSNNSSSTSDDGYYEISVNKGDKLKFSWGKSSFSKIIYENKGTSMDIQLNKKMSKVLGIY